MGKSELTALLALAAALFIAIGDATQHRSAHTVSDQPIGHLELLVRLLRDRRWWLGGVAAVTGTGLQIAALGLGSVLLVEVLLATSLLFALPINAALGGGRLGRSVWVWAVVLALADAVIVVVGRPTAGGSHAPLQTWAVVAAVLVPVMLLCLAGARIWPGRAAAVLLAAVSGLAWGTFAVLTKGVIDLLGRGPGTVLASPELYGWLLLALVGTVYQQASFRAGVLAASLPTTMLVEPVQAAVLSVLLLGETLRPGDAGWLVMAVAAAAMVVAITVLARSEAAAAPDRRGATASVPG